MISTFYMTTSQYQMTTRIYVKVLFSGTRRESRPDSEAFICVKRSSDTTAWGETIGHAGSKVPVDSQMVGKLGAFVSSVEAVRVALDTLAGTKETDPDVQKMLVEATKPLEHDVNVGEITDMGIPHAYHS